jgi:hypothetical protein
MCVCVCHMCVRARARACVCAQRTLQYAYDSVISKHRLGQVDLRKHLLHLARYGVAQLCSHFLRNVRLHTLAGSFVHHSPPNLRMRLWWKNVSTVGVVRAGADVGVAVACVTAHGQAPGAEVSTAAQPCHVASVGQATALQQQIN